MHNLNLFHSNLLFILFATISGFLYTLKVVNEPVDYKVRLTVQTDQSNDFTQFYCHINNTYKGESVSENSYSPENKTAENVYELVNDINCGEKATHLRFDPLSSAGNASILSMQIHTQYWKKVDLSEAIKHVRALHNIESVQLIDDSISIVANGDDPYIELSDNLQSYLTTSNQELVLLVLKYSFWAFLWIKLFTWVTAWVLKNGLLIYTKAESIKSHFDHHSGKFVDGLNKTILKPTPVSLVVSGLGLLIFAASSYVFVSHLSPQLNLGSLLMFAFIGIQFIFMLSIYLILLSIFGSFKWLRVVLGFVFLYSQLYLFFDVTLFSLNGMHIKHGVGLLTDGGIGQFFNNLRFTQLSKAELSIYLIILMVTFLLSFVAVWFAEIKLNNNHMKLSILQVTLACIVGLVLIYFTQHIASKHLNKKQIITYEQHHPLALSFFGVKDHIISFEVQAKPFKRSDAAPTITKKTTESQTQNIYLFILESIRADVVNTEVTPYLSEFKEDSWQFEQAIASGNATHYGWFSTINAREPFFWERYRDLNDKKGSVPLQLFKQLGYNINVYSGKDLSYLQSDQTMFGQDLSLLNYISPHPDMSPPEHDQRAIEELISDIKTKHQKSKNLNIIFLDSSHYPYRWIKNKFQEITPYEGTADEGTDLSNAKRMVKNDKTLIFNRYKNSIKFMDYLFGNMLDAIKQSNLNDRSVVIAVGDHGQQFMEHGYMMHGFTLFNEDINVPLYFQGPDIESKKDLKVASHVDIMPTILEHLDVDMSIIASLGGQSLFNDTGNDYKLSTVAGQQNTPATFVAVSTQWKMYFRTDINSPSVFNKIFITEITDHQDITYMPGDGLESDYLSFINNEFPNFLDQIDIFN